jgi:hypothetical protein
MPVSVTCHTCDARLKAPDDSAGRTFRCPRCSGAVVVPAAPSPASDFAFDRGTASSDDDENLFEDQGSAGESDETETKSPRKSPRPTANKKRPAGFNPFDEDTGSEDPPAGSLPKKRRYRKDGDYNPFGDLPQAEESDPVGEGFEFGLEAPPTTPTGEFDFGPLDPRKDDEEDRRRRRR